MTKSILITFIFSLTLFNGLVTGQKLNFSLGAISKFEKFNYVNQNGSSINTMIFDLNYGFGLGYLSKNKFSLNTGIQSFNTSDPIIYFNMEKGTSQLFGASVENDFLKSWMIPLEVGKKFLFFDEKLSLEPSIGLTTIFARNFPNSQPNKSWTLVDYSSPDTVMFLVVYDTTVAFTYRSAKIDFGLNISAAASYKVFDEIELVAKVGLHHSFYPLYYDMVWHESALETEVGISTFLGVSYYALLGVRYSFALKK